MGLFSQSALRRTSFVAIVAVASGVVWLALWEVFQVLLAFTKLKTGITLVYVPAGVRLVILLISGLWGAFGIALAFPLAVIQEFPDVSWEAMLVYSLVAGFIPYASLLWVSRAAGISRDLSTLRSIHLPLLVAVVSVFGALSYAIALVAFGRFDAHSFLQDVTAMAVGDFLGCFAVIALVRLTLLRRKGRN